MVFIGRLLNGRSSMPSLLASCGTLVAATPLVIWCHDSLFSLCRVRGSSMEPSLFSGDILVVRKADGFWQRWKLPTSSSSSSSSSRTTVEGGDEEKDDRQQFTENDEQSCKRERVLVYEREHCNSNGSIGLLRKPPTPLTGNIVVFKDPKKYPDRWSIERVAAIGGETVHTTPLTSSNTQQEGESSSNRLVMSSGKKETKPGSTAFVPPYCIWVEGDNLATSIDSRTRGHGSVSKKLLIGIAEYRLWPPWRIGKLDNKNKPNSS